MSDEDKELEHLKKRRLAEMEKNIALKQNQTDTSDSKETPPSARDLLLKKLGYRGLEVFENAEFQFPNETKIVVEKLGELLSSGEVDEEIDGGKLLALFRSVGINVRMQTKINVEQDGKFVSLSEKLTRKSSNTEISNDG